MSCRFPTIAHVLSKVGLQQILWCPIVLVRARHAYTSLAQFWIRKGQLRGHGLVAGMWNDVTPLVLSRNGHVQWFLGDGCTCRRNRAPEAQSGHASIRKVIHSQVSGRRGAFHFKIVHPRFLISRTERCCWKKSLELDVLQSVLCCLYFFGRMTNTLMAKSLYQPFHGARKFLDNFKCLIWTAAAAAIITQITKLKTNGRSVVSGKVRRIHFHSLNA
mmetsp:Transcript_30898/g.45781  ORF Transcript_30898/g.45781 Transcript_30898/m.45781 type:complete len:217 (-) Transcript_30898:477-1127(-)